MAAPGASFTAALSYNTPGTRQRRKRESEYLFNLYLYYDQVLALEIVQGLLMGSVPQNLYVCVGKAIQVPTALMYVIKQWSMRNKSVTNIIGDSANRVHSSTTTADFSVALARRKLLRWDRLCCCSADPRWLFYEYLNSTIYCLHVILCFDFGFL